MWIANVTPQDDGSILMKVCSTWLGDLRGQIKLLFWTVE